MCISFAMQFTRNFHASVDENWDRQSFPSKGISVRGNFKFEKYISYVMNIYRYIKHKKANENLLNTFI